jgi:hypothetical protein
MNFREGERFCPLRGQRCLLVVAIVSSVVAFAIWLVSWVINVDTKSPRNRGAKVVEIANKRVPRPYRFLFLASPAGQLGKHPDGRFGHVPTARQAHLGARKVTLDYQIFTRWPARYPDRLQLFSAPTPNGVERKQ